MPDSATAADLMFRPAGELAGLVRDGQQTFNEMMVGYLGLEVPVAATEASGKPE